MAVQQDYARLAIFYSNNALTQVTSIALNTESGQQRVDLLNEGLGGWTPGSGSVSIEIGFVVPIGGQEDTFQEDCATGKYVTMQIPIGRKSYIGKGKVTSVKISQSTNASTEGSLSWEGSLSPLS
jgi:hypothetical protein